MASEVQQMYRDYIRISKYSRWLEQEGRRETWQETVERYCAYLKKSAPCLATDEYTEIYNAIMNHEVMPSMRALACAGEALDQENIAAYNCSYVKINRPRVFSEILYILMCGAGVGFSVERQYINELPIVPSTLEKTDEVIKVGDSRQGWAEALDTLINTLYTGRIPGWDMSGVRPKGARIKTFGGRSSGPGVLALLFSFVIQKFTDAVGRRLQSIECHDICCKIADVVICGGTRRSATLSLSNLSDQRMRMAKTGEWYISHPHRALANNSVAYTEKPNMGIFMEEWKTLYDSRSGERGIFNRQAAQNTVKRIGRRDPNHEFGCNPCSEVILRDCELCNLTEIVIRSSDTAETLFDKMRIATIIGTIQATWTKFNYVCPKWAENCNEERLLGVSLTGIFDNPLTYTNDGHLISLLKRLKRRAIEINKTFAERIGINQAAAITLVKPSGCSVATSMIPTSKGILTLAEIGNVKGDQWQEHDINVCTADKPTKSTKFYINGVAPTKKIYMKTGLILESTLNHKYKVLNGKTGELEWKSCEDIRPNDMIPYQVGGYDKCCPTELIKLKSIPVNARYTMKPTAQPTEINADLAWFLGLYFGDGSNHKRGIRIAGEIRKLSDLTRAGDIIQKQFGLRYHIISNPHPSEKSRDLYINSVFLTRWLTANQLSKQKSKNVCIPLAIRQSPADIIRAFIDGYWHADGSTMPSNGNRSWCTISRTMAEQLVICLRLTGTDATMREMPPTATSYGTNMRYWIAECKGRKGRYDTRIDCLGKMFKILDDCKLNTYSPDIVVKVEDSEAETYDIEVPDGNLYQIQGGYMSHNTLSQLVDCASGIHPRYSKYYIRTVRNANTDPLTTFMKEAGIPYEQDLFNENNTVFSFPIAAPEGAMTRKELDAETHLELWRTYQMSYCEHKPSVTITVCEDEWLDVGAWIYRNFDWVSGVAFLPYDGGIYQQAPYQEIDEEKYEQLVAAMPKNINWVDLRKYEKNDNCVIERTYACTANRCEL